MAYNLALSIKAVEPEMPVAVVCTEGALGHLDLSQLAIFDHIIPLPDGAPDVCGCKLWVDLVTPFERTLLLDADMIWLPNRRPSDLFAELEGNDFTAVAEGFHIVGATEGHQHHPQYFFWADPNEIATVYELEAGRKIYQWRSETVYFTGRPEVFETARAVYLNPRLSTVKPYGAGVPDELALNVACAVNDIHPHAYQWRPAYWHMMADQRFDNVQAIYNNYWLATFGSNVANADSRAFYDKLMKYYCYKMNTQHIFPLQSKRDKIPERVKI
jgi:hypothetical protein